ncbi:putative amino acid dehydrogenase [Kineosphaera limosa NBRC 100340]|uniref:Putative amino acid dehydrogenase n=2 Tax=Kineosphaera TaxID=211469 RepID=K6WS97_9MICO|nr:putative amino acid dehydrogenase [Kineosphaera limosa NBRC 100340]
MVEGTALNPWVSEQVLTCSDDDTGLRAVIAIDDTTLGPGFGGVRLAPYPSALDAIVEAQRLAATMTRKHALADLPYGGAQAVILEHSARSELAGVGRQRVFEKFAQVVRQLGGHFIPGVDMGTTQADMRCMQSAGARVYSVGEDPYPWIARGVHAAIRAGAGHAWGSADLVGMRVALQGAGHVGAALARLLADDGARVLVGDVDHDRARRLADRVGGLVIDPADAPYAQCDVFVPCAVAQVLRVDSADRLQCRLIAGSANDILADDAAAEAIAAAGVSLVPDFVANAGGVIHEHARAMGWDTERLAEDVDRIGTRVGELLARATETGQTPWRVAVDRAHERLSHARDI